MLPGHGLEGFYRLQGVGEIGHQRVHQPGLALAGTAGDSHQEVRQADDHDPGADGRERGLPGQGEGHGAVYDRLDQEGNGGGPVDEGRGGALGLRGQGVGELAHRLVQEVLPLAAQHGPQHLQAQVGAHLGRGITHLALRQQQEEAFHGHPHNQDGQHIAQGGRDADESQRVQHRLFEFVLVL